MIMRRIIIAAAALLAIQLTLAVALNRIDTGNLPVSPATPLFSFAADSVTALEITGPEGERLVLQKKESGWVLPDSFAAPAADEQVTALLAKLADLKQGFTVATSNEAAKRFKVADDGFERHVVLREGDQVVGDLYVGSSPAFRQVHARAAGTDAVFIVALSNFDLETGADKWLDKTLFMFKAEDVDSLAFADFTLLKKDDTWQLENLEEGRQTDSEAADNLLNEAGNLTIQDVLDPQDVQVLFNDQPAFADTVSFTVSFKDGTRAEYRFAKSAADYFVLKQSGRDQYFKVHTLPVENLLKYTREQLVKQEGSNSPD